MSSNLHPRLWLLEQSLAPAPLNQIIDAEISKRQLELWIKRDDLLHPIMSGNKWRKLKFILNHALNLHCDCLVSMGGTYSNHLHALAFAGKQLGIKTSARIRGERPDQFNPTLIDLENWGMELEFISRGEYRQLRYFKQHNSLPGLNTGEYWLPEGGAAQLALKGVAETVAEINMTFDVLVVACGTGATLAGLIAKAPKSSRVLGIATVKNAGFLIYDVQQLLNSISIQRNNWQIALDYHCGGFAQTTPALLEFISQFTHQHDIPLEPVYTGKLMFALYDLIKKDYFKTGQRIVVLHTGGMQGNRNFRNFSNLVR